MSLTIEKIKLSLANRIRVRRLEVGISQEAFADLAGIDRTYASQIERGIANPSLEVLWGVCKALDLELEELFSSPSARG